MIWVIYKKLELIYVQTKRHVLATDEWLRVNGCEDVFAIGDCSSIKQRKVMVPLKPLTLDF